MLTVFVTALVGTAAAMIAPGPNLLAVASVALAKGRTMAYAVAAGIACGTIIWSSVFAVGVGALFQAYPIAGTALQLMGGAYLLYLAIRVLLAAYGGETTRIDAVAQERSIRAAWLKGFLVNMTNPKAPVIWAAITAFLSGSGADLTGLLLFGPLASVAALVIYCGYGYLFSTPAARHFYSSTARAFQFTFAAMFGLIGARLVYGGLAELQE